MIKKYLDEENFVVGISYGDITNISKETNYDNARHIMDVLETKPQRTGYKSRLLDSETNNIYEYNFIFEKIPESDWSDDLIKEMFQQQIMDSVVVNSRPAKKNGYELKPVLNGTNISWEFVKIDGAAEEDNEASGDYLNPIPYVPGMTVVVGKWYTDGEDIWECLANGIPVDFSDRNYFDIIG